MYEAITSDFMSGIIDYNFDDVNIGYSIYAIYKRILKESTSNSMNENRIEVSFISSYVKTNNNITT